MPHLPPLIFDLTVILAAAGLATLLFNRWRQPVVLGYLVAGFAAGPHFPLWPTVVDTTGVSLWAEIGVIFLLFGLGLEFSFKKLARVGKSASIAALFELITMSGVGYLLGRALGWNTMDSIFLGAILSMSSTTIIIRAFDEAGAKGRAFVGLVFGILIVEDLMAILLMVILTAISSPLAFSGASLVKLSAWLLFFLLIWFMAGIFFLPNFLRRARPYITREILLVVSIALCFLMVVVSDRAGFSAALGAFMMGSLLAETDEGERVSELLAPVKDLFAAVFFVSVGMMIDPKVLQQHFGVIFLITVVTIVGKLLGSGFGAILSGRSLRHSVQAGMSLAQIGEFSFILAALGASLNATSSFLYPIVVAVSAVTTFTTPYMIRHSDWIYGRIEASLPQRLLDALRRYEQTVNAGGRAGALLLLWRTYAPPVVLNGAVVVGVILACSRWLSPALGNQGSVKLAAAGIALVASAPFLWALSFKTPKGLSRQDADTLVTLRGLQLGVLLFRGSLGLGLLAFLASEFVSSTLAPLLILAGAPVLLFFARNYLESFYVRLEKRFLENLSAKKLKEVEAGSALPVMIPWDAGHAVLDVQINAAAAGRTIGEAGIRSKTGATIAMIDRGRHRLFAPAATERILPGDRLYLIGTDEQILAAGRFVKECEEETALILNSDHRLEAFQVKPDSSLSGRSIRGAGELVGGTVLIVGVERGAARILNPEAGLQLAPGDLLWAFGSGAGLRELRQRAQA